MKTRFFWIAGLGVLAGLALVDSFVPPGSSAEKAEWARFESSGASSSQDKSSESVSSATTSLSTETTATDTCEGSKSGREVLGAMQAIEQTIQTAQALQAATFKKQGRTAKQAADAGESVLLNGAGYSYRFQNK